MQHLSGEKALDVMHHHSDNLRLILYQPPCKHIYLVIKFLYRLLDQDLVLRKNVAPVQIFRYRGQGKARLIFYIAHCRCHGFHFSFHNAKRLILTIRFLVNHTFLY